jgi:hypothetical protein
MSIRTGKTTACEWCGKEVYHSPSQIREHTYCSRTCSNRAQSQVLRDNPSLRTSKGTAVICANCSKEFHVKPHRVTKAKFCSKVCNFAYRFGRTNHRQAKDMRGANNPNYRGTNNHVTARLTALGAFPHKCILCGFDAVVDVHHIIPQREGGTNDLTNLAVLCPNHHRLADIKRISRDELTKTVLAAIAQQQDRPPPSDQQ